MDYKKFVVVVFLSTFFISSFVSKSYATDMTTTIVPQLNEAQASFKADRIITITYDPNGALSKKFSGTHETVKFKANMSTPGMQEAISIINQDILQQRNSPIKIVNATLDYRVQIDGIPGQLKIGYLLTIKPFIDMTDAIRSSENDSSAGRFVDLDWRSFAVTQPLNITGDGVGPINVNYPIGLFQAKFPEIATQLENSEAGSMLKKPLLDFDLLGQSLDTWHFLFDPTGSQAGMSGSGFEEIGGSKVVSIFSLGESSFREGTFKDVEEETQSTIDGTQVKIHAFTAKPSGQIQIAGFAKVQKTGDSEIAFVTENAPQGTTTSTGGFPLQVLLAFVGIMGGVVVLVFLKVRKKEEKS